MLKSRVLVLYIYSSITATRYQDLSVSMSMDLSVSFLDLGLRRDFMAFFI